MNHNIISLLLAMDLVELQNTCEKKLNRKILERPNKCYIFEKLGIQGYQIHYIRILTERPVVLLNAIFYEESRWAEADITDGPPGFTYIVIFG